MKMGDVERNEASSMMDGTGSLVTVSIQEDKSANSTSLSRPRFDLGMTLGEIGMGVSFEMDEPEGLVEGEARLLSPHPHMEDEESVLDIPELAKPSAGLPPRTIPFRSASFSQVDITSEGKYVRINPRSPITLKPTAFCLLNPNNPNPNSTSTSNTVLAPASNATTLTTPTPPTTTAGQTGGTGQSQRSTGSPSPHHHPVYNSSTLPRHGEKYSTFPLSAESSVKCKPLLERKTGAQHIHHLNKAHNLLSLPPLATPSSLKQQRFSQNGGKNNQNNRLLSGASECDFSALQNQNRNQIQNQNQEGRESILLLAADLVNVNSCGLRTEISSQGDRSVISVSQIIADRDKLLLDEESERWAAGQRDRSGRGNAHHLSEEPQSQPHRNTTTGGTVHFYLGPEESTLGDTQEFKLAEISSPPPSIFPTTTHAQPDDNDDDKRREESEHHGMKATVETSSRSRSRSRDNYDENPNGIIILNDTLESTNSNSKPGGTQDNIEAETQTEEPLGTIQDLTALSSQSPVDTQPPSQSESEILSELVEVASEASVPPETEVNKMDVGVKMEEDKGAPPQRTETEMIECREDEEKNQLLRQSSGQSDGSDEITSLAVMSTSAHSNVDLTTCSSPPSDKDLPRNISFPGYHHHHHHPGPIGSPPIGSSVSSLGGLKAPNYTGNKKEISRANSVSCSSSGNEVSSRPLPPRRYNKRPLRGPYGEMLEAEMNKLIPVRSLRDYDNSDFYRESKSSSPNRSLSSGLSQIDPDTRSPALASSNHLLMASMDDLHFSTNQQKTLNPRSRKISTQLPVQTPHFPGETAATLAFHQRTASSPSQLLYSTPTERSPNTREPDTRSRQLDGSPRGHVLAEVVETEKSYVDSLRILVKKYMEPLKLADFIDAGLVDEIFFQIPKILWHHERLLDALQKRVTDDTQCVGDVLLETFRQNSLLECYSLFVNNWKNAKGSLKMAVASKPPLARFLEDNARQHKGKLTLDSLLIMPIQRIPRYELLVKELLKHTDPSHEDHSRLTLALENIKQFALHIDCASVDPNDNREIEIEGWGSGLGHLVRQDIVTLCSTSNVKKERALFLFADSLVIASIKRKSTMRKPSASTSHNVGNSWEGCKFKLLMKIPLMDAHLLNEDYDGGSLSGTVTTGNKSTSSSSSFTSKSGGVGSLNSHEETDDLKIIHKMMELATMLKCAHAGLDEILKDLASGLKHHCDNGDAVDFEIKSSDNSDSPEVLKILFCSVEKKSGWLESFQDTLGKFIRYGFGKLPQVQFSQALPIRKTRAGLQLSCAAPVSLHNKVSKTLEMSDVWVANSDGYVGQICILTLHPEPAITSCNGVCNSRITCIISVPPPPPPQAQPLHPALAAHHHHDDHQHPHVHSLGYESEDDTHRNRQGHKTAEHWSVWLGTEDGGLHVYDCSDSVRVKKNRHKIQHNAPLHCIVYFDSRVFVSLGNGDVAVYSRNTSGKGWSIGDPSWVTIGSALNPVTKMICVRSQIWCACGSQIKVYGENGGMLELLQSIQVSVEGNHMARGISCIVHSEEHVWVAVQGTSILKCYNNANFECLYETNVSSDVSKILAGCDDIIRQHKSACLRVTALLVAPDKTLWVGTSAGVILTLTATNQSYKTTPLCYGHTGQVRFMTCCTTRDSCTVISGGDGYEEFRPLPSLFHPNNNNSSSFGSMMSSLMGESSVDISGREDSTNHLLIWKIPKPS